MTQDAAMRMSTEMLRRELARLLADDADAHISDIAIIRYELHRRDAHGADFDIDHQ